MIDQLLWRLGRIWEAVYQSLIRAIHRPKVIDFGDGVEPPEDFTGTWEVFWPNGKIKYRAIMRDGVEHGECTCFWEDGLIAQSGRMRNGSYFGEWQDFTEMGWHYKTTVYIDSSNFTNTLFFPDGSISKRDRWENGLMVECEEFEPPESGGLIVTRPEQGSDGKSDTVAS